MLTPNWFKLIPDEDKKALKLLEENPNLWLKERLFDFGKRTESLLDICRRNNINFKVGGNEMVNVSETYIIGVDIVNQDVPVISIARKVGDKLDDIHTVEDEKARELYRVLSTTEKKPVIIKNHGAAYCPRCISDVHGMGRIQYCPRCNQGLEWPDSLQGMDIDGDLQIKTYMDPSIYEKDEYIPNILYNHDKDRVLTSDDIKNIDVSGIIKEAKSCIIKDLGDTVDNRIINYLKGGNNND